LELLDWGDPMERNKHKKSEELEAISTPSAEVVRAALLEYFPDHVLKNLEVDKLRESGEISFEREIEGRITRHLYSHSAHPTA